MIKKELVEPETLTSVALQNPFVWAYIRRNIRPHYAFRVLVAL